MSNQKSVDDQALDLDEVRAAAATAAGPASGDFRAGFELGWLRGAIWAMRRAAPGVAIVDRPPTRPRTWG